MSKRINITVAETAGFCFGVNRAVNLVYQLLQEGKKVCTLGPIIHNHQVVDDLKQKGVRIIHSPLEAFEDECVVIRSHGVSGEVYNLLKQHKIDYVDATCPFVTKIHTLVAKAPKNVTVLIVGNAYHPEVIGIRGHCKSQCYIFETVKELESLLNEIPGLKKTPLMMVAQTTFDLDTWKKIKKITKNVCTNIQIFDTICYTTSKRQKEAVDLAKKSDAMLVIGGRHSSNTGKLLKLCENQTRTFLIETADDLQNISFDKIHSLGITAGASTPEDIIKEVYKKMDEMNQNHTEELSFSELFEQSDQQGDKLYRGKQVKGVVASVAKDEVQVDIGGKQSGIIPLSEWGSADVDLLNAAKPGDELTLMVLRVNEQDGLVTLSKRQMDEINSYKSALQDMNNKTILTGKIVGIIKGGALISYQSIKIFIPISQLSDHHIDNPVSMLNKEVEYRILEVNIQKKKAVGSVRNVLIERKKEREEEIWKTVQIGQTFVGTVRTLTSYGAFVDIGGVDGLVHITELSWSKLKHPSQVVNVGDTIEVYIKNLDYEHRKISLGYRKYEDNPWVKFKQEYQVGQTIKGKVASVTSFGAFVNIMPGIDGLVHISQASDKRIDKLSDVLTVGQEVEARIISIDAEEQRVGLSIRILLEEAKEEKENENLKAIEHIEGISLSDDEA